MEAALSPLCRFGLNVLPFLDNLVICALLFQEAGLATIRVMAHVKALGLAVNEQKSQFGPTQQTTFIGMALNLVAMKAQLTTERMDRILCLLCLFILGRHPQSGYDCWGC